MTTRRRPIRVYELFPLGLGEYSTRMADYGGTVLAVAAVSHRQALVLARQRIWINPAVEDPIGIISRYTHRAGIRLWCGCEGHGVIGGDVSHGASLKTLKAAIAAHVCDPRHQKPATPAKVANISPLAPLRKPTTPPPTTERNDPPHVRTDPS